MGFGPGSAHNQYGGGLKGSFGSKMDTHLRHHPFGLYEDDEDALELEETKRSRVDLPHAMDADLEAETDTASATAVGEGSRGVIDSKGGREPDGALGLDLGSKGETSTGTGAATSLEFREVWERDSVSFSAESTR